MKINVIALKRLADRIIYQPEDGFTNLSSVLWRVSRNNEFLTIEQIESEIIVYLDENAALVG